MKVFPVSPEQLKEIQDQQAVVKATGVPYQEAQANLKKIITTISGGETMMRGWQLSDDNKSLVIQ